MVGEKGGCGSRAERIGLGGTETQRVQRIPLDDPTDRPPRKGRQTGAREERRQRLERRDRLLRRLGREARREEEPLGDAEVQCRPEEAVGVERTAGESGEVGEDPRMLRHHRERLVDEGPAEPGEDQRQVRDAPQWLFPEFRPIEGQSGRRREGSGSAQTAGDEDGHPPFAAGLPKPHRGAVRGGQVLQGRAHRDGDATRFEGEIQLLRPVGQERIQTDRTQKPFRVPPHHLHHEIGADLRAEVSGAEPQDEGPIDAAATRDESLFVAVTAILVRGSADRIAELTRRTPDSRLDVADHRRSMLPEPPSLYSPPMSRSGSEPVPTSDSAAGGAGDTAAWSTELLASDPHARQDKAERVRAMFASIARRYDINNRLHSFGLDQRWRRRAVALAAIDPTSDVVDVACGTGDLSEAFAAAGARSVIGIDYTPQMLEVAREKAKRRGGTAAAVEYREGDATRLDLPDASCDVVSIAFGIRNVAAPRAAMAEFHRILRPGGRLVILEFSEPENRLIRAGHRLYTRHVMPRTAALVAGDRAGAYRYLPRSVETFLGAGELAEAARDAGFADVRSVPLTCGVCTITVGRKQSDGPVGPGG